MCNTFSMGSMIQHLIIHLIQKRCCFSLKSLLPTEEEVARGVCASSELRGVSEVRRRTFVPLFEAPTTKALLAPRNGKGILIPLLPFSSLLILLGTEKKRNIGCYFCCFQNMGWQWVHFVLGSIRSSTYVEN